MKMHGELEAFHRYPSPQHKKDNLASFKILPRYFRGDILGTQCIVGWMASTAF
jgi:hypothetical protein